MGTGTFIIAIQCASMKRAPLSLWPDALSPSQYTLLITFSLERSMNLSLRNSFALVVCVLASSWSALAAIDGPTPFGKAADGKSVDLFTLTNDKGMLAKVMTFGAVLVDLQVPDKAGKPDSVVLGYDNLNSYEKGSFYGATVGRFANRIKDARFTLDGKEYKLTGNIHGGKKGFN